MHLICSLALLLLMLTLAMMCSYLTSAIYVGPASSHSVRYACKVHPTTVTPPRTFPSTLPKYRSLGCVRSDLEHCQQSTHGYLRMIYKHTHKIYGRIGR